MNHYFRKVLYGVGAIMLVMVIWFTWFVLFYIPRNRIEYQKYEDHLNLVSPDIIETLQKDPEIHGINKESLIDEQNHHCSLRGGDSSCVEKFKLIQKVVSKIPSEVWFYRCHFSKGDIFIRQRRDYFGSGAHKYEFFVPSVQEDLKSLQWIEYDQNRDSWYEIECDPWEEQ